LRPAKLSTLLQTVPETADSWREQKHRIRRMKFEEYDPLLKKWVPYREKEFEPENPRSSAPNWGKHPVGDIVLYHRKDKKGRKRGAVVYSVFWYERGPHKEEIFQGTGGPRVYLDPKYAPQLRALILKAEKQIDFWRNGPRVIKPMKEVETH